MDGPTKHAPLTQQTAVFFISPRLSLNKLFSGLTKRNVTLEITFAMENGKMMEGTDKQCHSADSGQKIVSLVLEGNCRRHIVPFSLEVLFNNAKKIVMSFPPS